MLAATSRASHPYTDHRGDPRRDASAWMGHVRLLMPRRVTGGGPCPPSFTCVMLLEPLFPAPMPYAPAVESDREASGKASGRGVLPCYMSQWCCSAELWPFNWEDLRRLHGA